MLNLSMVFSPRDMSAVEVDDIVGSEHRPKRLAIKLECD